MPKPKAYDGLTARQVAERRAQFGWNELAPPKPVSPWAVLARQFTGLLVLMLIAAAGIALAVGEIVDAAAIGAVVLLNGVLGFVQEWRAERAMVALRRMMSPMALVIRDGGEAAIPARELVPGDLIVLAEGDRVPADAEILTEVGLKVDESVLTGESVPVFKTPGEEAFSGTTVTTGHAEARVIHIGEATQFGQVAQLTGAVQDSETTLQIQLGILARQLGQMALIVAVLVAAMGWWQGLERLQVFMLGLSMAVAMVPEGLPAVVTVTLALGAATMARRNALVRHLQAVETLGAASVICTDKTGTLTENQMTACRIWTRDREYTITGTGYDPAGHVESGGTKLRAQDDKILDQLCHVGQACTHARLAREGDAWRIYGDPTEAALLVLAHKAWCDLPETSRVLAELPFTSDRKRMSVLERSDDGDRILLKGAPELVLEICTSVMTRNGPEPLDQAALAQARGAADAMAANGLRVIALASRTVADNAGTNIEETDMTLVGFAGLIDPPRPEVAHAIAAAARAGIRTMMITGDHPATARNVAEQLGIAADDVLTGPDLDALDEDALRGKLAGNVAFARVSPAHKLRIVGALKDIGETVAMTGDGVNDAAALRKADIGVAMAIRGTEVAKDASDLVLLDDNYATIVSAIREGRRQFANTRKFVLYLISSNTGEVIALLLNTALGLPLIFLPTQILWMNLITDGVTAVALGLEPAEADQMKDPPRPAGERILTWRNFPIILMFGLYTGLSCVWLFITLLPLGVDVARTAAFSAMVVFEKVCVFAFRSLRAPGWRLGWFTNPPLLLAFSAMMLLQVAAVYWAPLQTVLHTVPLGLYEWQLIGALALPLIIVPELVKTLIRRRSA